jgi:hypothetical protein
LERRDYCFRDANLEEVGISDAGESSSLGVAARRSAGSWRRKERRHMADQQVDLPYSHVINYLKIIDLVFEDDVAQKCWSILNDMLVRNSFLL